MSVRFRSRARSRDEPRREVDARAAAHRGARNGARARRAMRRCATRAEGFARGLARAVADDGARGARGGGARGTTTRTTTTTTTTTREDATASATTTSATTTFEERARARSRRSEAKRRLRTYRFAEAEASEGARARRNGNARTHVGGYFDGFEIRGRKKESAFDDGRDARRETAREGARLFRRFARERGGGGGFADSRLRDDGDEAFFRAYFGSREGGGDRARVDANGFYARAGCEHCEALGLKSSEFVTPEALKTALREQALKWHPDRHDDEKKPIAEARFKRVYDAYEYLAERAGARSSE